MIEEMSMGVWGAKNAAGLGQDWEQLLPCKTQFRGKAILGDSEISQIKINIWLLE